MVILIAALILDYHIVFPITDVADFELLNRYFDQRHIQTIASRSLSLGMDVDAPADVVDPLLDSFSKEFEVEFSRSDMVSVVPKTSFPFETEVSDAPQSWNSYAPDSLIRKAFAQLVKNKQAEKGEELVQCRYWLRPWISKALKKTETISGVFTLRKGKQVRDVSFAYDR